MPDSLRNGTVTVIVLLVALFAVWTLFVWQASQQKSYYQEKAQAVANDSAQRTDERIKRTCIKETSPALIAKCVQNAIETSRSDQRAEYDLEAQRQMADWTLGVLGLSILTLGVSVFGIYYVRQTLMETRRIGQAEVRAYVTCESARFEVTPMGLSVKPIFHNTGNSPTSTMKIMAGLKAGNTLSAIVDGRTLKFENELLGSAPSLASGEKRNGFISWHDERFEEAYINERGLLHFGADAIVQWVDVFGSTCESEFSLWIDEIDAPNEHAFILYSGTMRATNSRFQVQEQ
jgi:hypothetical protein